MLLLVSQLQNLLLLGTGLLLIVANYACRHVTDAVSLPLVSKTFPNLTLGAFSDDAVYTLQDVDALLSYAKDRGVRVVLELDMPGHNWAYSVAFPHLFANCSSLKGLPIQTEFWQDAFDPTQPELYQFLEALLKEMALRFPDSVMHLGGVSTQ